MSLKRVIFIALLLFFWQQQGLFAQKTAIFDQPEADYRQAIELFHKQKYGSARQLFEQVIGQIDTPHSETRVNATYYQAACAVELFHPDAENLMTAFIEQYPMHAKQGMAYFQMGNLQYRKRKYTEATQWYAKVDLFDLSAEEKEEYYFKNGYSFFMEENFDFAKRNFFEIKNKSSRFYPAASYYYGHISYQEGKYETALMYFNNLKQDENFGPIVPYYIAHILHLQGKYDELLAFAPSLLEDANPKRSSEINRLIGEAYFQKGDYQKSLVHLEDYFKQNRSKAGRKDYYQLGYAYYVAGDYAKAIPNLQRVTNIEDTLGQNAYYHLADAFVKTNQKLQARNAFLAVYKMDFEPSLKQDALFNYAKLSYELSYNPFNEAIIAFQKYIADYPKSPRVNEAYGYLIDLYLTTKNYKDALESIEKIGLKDKRLKEAYQRIAFYRGVELFNNGDFSGAVSMFDKSLTQPENNGIRAQSLYWKGEAFYRMNEFDKSVQAHNLFLLSPGAFSQEFYNRAHYNIGYAYFKIKNYPQAIVSFRKFVLDRKEDRKLVNDAYLRIGDSFFITKDFNNAIEFYDQAIKIGVIDTDYAYFQKALAQGVTGRFEAKIATLSNMLNAYPRSAYAADAKYEIANSYLILDNNNRALDFFNRIIKDHPNSSYVKNAQLKSGLVYYNNNDNQKALEIFKGVVSKYPGTPESQEALVTIKNIYVGMDRVDEFFNYTKNIGFANVTQAQQDSLTYSAAENRYLNGDCENAVRSFGSYIERFPNGIFAINANFYKAECEFRANQFERALTGYEFVINSSRSKFTENAVSRAAAINFRLKNYDAAYRQYVMLEQQAEFKNNLTEARAGQMRSAFHLMRYAQAMSTSRSVLLLDKVSNELRQEAHLIIGKSALATDSLEIAKNAFEQVSRIAINELAAEARYNLSFIEFKKGNYKRSEELIFKFINEMNAYDYWLAKSFILLADNYLAVGNTFQAKHTLQSIIDNYDGRELVDIATRKLEDIVRIEREQEQKRSKDQIEVDFGKTPQPRTSLFD